MRSSKHQLLFLRYKKCGNYQHTQMIDWERVREKWQFTWPAFLTPWILDTLAPALYFAGRWVPNDRKAETTNKQSFDRAPEGARMWASCWGIRFSMSVFARHGNVWWTWPSCHYTSAKLRRTNMVQGLRKWHWHWLHPVCWNYIIGIKPGLLALEFFVQPCGIWVWFCARVGF